MKSSGKFKTISIDFPTNKFANKFHYLCRYMHGRACSNKLPDESGPVDPLEMPVPSTSGGRTRRTGLLTVMERPPGSFKVKTLFIFQFYSVNS